MLSTAHFLRASCLAKFYTKFPVTKMDQSDTWLLEAARVSSLVFTLWAAAHGPSLSAENDGPCGAAMRLNYCATQ